MNIVTSKVLTIGLFAFIAISSAVLGPLIDNDLDPAPTESEVIAAGAANLRDALAQHQADNPGLWSEKSKARAYEAALIATEHTVVMP